MRRYKMTVAIAIAFVCTAVQFIKKVFPAIAGTAAVVAVVVLSAGTTAYKFVNEGTPLTIAAALFFVEVVVGALGAYSLVKVAAGSN